MAKINVQAVNIGLNVFVILGLVVCIILSGVVMKEGNTAALQLSLTKELAQELRQSSDDLTRFIRTYTVTGNHSYWDYFQRVIRIRNGVDPLPMDPWRNYWDLYISDGQSPRGFTAPSALTDRMAAAGFTAQELEYLNEAKRQSDALIDMEDVAYSAMNGKYRPTNIAGLTPSQAKEFSVTAAPNQTFAMLLVHGWDYHSWKGRIMRPIDDFASLSTRRVITSIDNNYRINIILVALLSLLLLLLISLLVVYFGKVARDSQTAQLLSTVLPARVVDTVPVAKFTELKQMAGAHALTVGKNADGTSKAAMRMDFPVLYSEFLPICWVAFTDVVQFTKMCRYTPSRQVISVLNELFSLLDVEAFNFGVEKIKTIGDAFMAAKLSTSELNAAVDEATRIRTVSADGLCMARFLLRAMELAEGVTRPQPSMPIQQDDKDDGDWEDESVLRLRCGLHVGPVASGIVGFERPLYDLFGDTVNTAARLEASGVPNAVHIMETTCSYFDNEVSKLEFDREVRKVALKGIGQASTRLVVGVKDDASSSHRSISRKSQVLKSKAEKKYASGAANESNEKIQNT